MEDNVDTPSRRAGLLEKRMVNRLFDGKIGPQQTSDQNEDDAL
jgi:hypothetical protein